MYAEIKVGTMIPLNFLISVLKVVAAGIIAEESYILALSKKLYADLAVRRLLIWPMVMARPKIVRLSASRCYYN